MCLERNLQKEYSWKSKSLKRKLEHQEQKKKKARVVVVAETRDIQYGLSSLKY